MITALLKLASWFQCLYRHRPQSTALWSEAHSVIPRLCVKLLVPRPRVGSITVHNGPQVEGFDCKPVAVVEKFEAFGKACWKEVKSLGSVLQEHEVCGG